MEIKSFKKTFRFICNKCGEFSHTRTEFCEKCGFNDIRKATKNDYSKFVETHDVVRRKKPRDHPKNMISNIIIIAFGVGFLLVAIIAYAQLFAPLYSIFLLGICLICAGSGNEKEKEKSPKRRDWKSIAGRIGPKIVSTMGSLFLIEGITRILIFKNLLFLFYPDTPFLLIYGILAIVGVLLGVKGYNYGRFFCLIAGILALMVFLIFYVTFPYRFILTMFTIFIPFQYVLFLIALFSLFIFLIGGILSVISGESFLNYKEKRNFSPI